MAVWTEIEVISMDVFTHYNCNSTTVQLDHTLVCGLLKIRVENMYENSSVLSPRNAFDSYNICIVREVESYCHEV